MARAASIAPPSRASTARNIEETSDNARYINFRTDPDTFREIKKAALDLDMKLGEYLVHCHTAFQQNREG